MKSRLHTILLWLCLVLPQALFSLSAFAETIYIGAGEQFEYLSDAEKFLQDGDVVEIVPGVYNDCTIIRANDLVIRPKGWPASQDKVRFEDVACDSKAIFVIMGNNTRIEGIEFANARVPDGNGAGIRLEGASLALEDTYFYNNEMGILSGNNEESVVTINNSVFEKNGREPPVWGHGIYFGKIASLHVTNSTFFNQRTGHHIKSRALHTEVIGNTISDGDIGNASYSIDIPNGGSVIIEGNKVQKGPLSDNIVSAICIACEGEENRGRKIIVRNNEFTNDLSKRVIFVRNLTGISARLSDNQLLGNKSVLIEGPSL